MDIFSTRRMLNPLLQNFKPRTFLRSTFFPKDTIFDTENVDIDLRWGKRRMAPFVRPRRGGKVVERSGYETKTYKPPLVAPQMPTTAEDMLKRVPGENMYNPKDPMTRASEQLGHDSAELMDMIDRREEWMCAQALFEGKIHMVSTDEGIDDEIDFKLPLITLSGTSLWNNADSDPLADLREWSRQVSRNSGYVPTMAILASDVIDALLNNDKVLKILDKRRVEMGQINPQQLPNGASYIGHINLPEVDLDLYGYNEWVEDETSGDDVPLVPSGRLLLANPNARTEMLYGAIANAKIGVVSEPRVPYSWVEEDGSARFLRVSSRPLPVPVQVPAFLRCAVL